MAKPLARVTDVDALDAHQGTCARLKITVPADWARATVELSVPRLLSCDRCGGGGCDRCARSGALSAPNDAHQRRLRLTLPAQVDRTSLIRLPVPFEDPHIEQLIVEVHIGPEPSDGVRRLRVAPAAALATSSHSASPPALMVALVIMALLVLGVLLTQR